MAYLYINQSIEFFSAIFRNSIKRPDFLVLIPNIGFIAVDVKHHTCKNNSFTLSIKSEIVKSSEFEHLTKLYLWYAYKKKNMNDNSWYFISAYDAMENGKVISSQKTEDFLSIELKYFKVVTDANDFSKLFSARIGTIGLISKTLGDYFSKKIKV